jgi:hypothetical protein
MDHKIWASPEETHTTRNSDAAFHLYARLNLTSVWRSTTGEQHLLKIEVKFSIKRNSMSFFVLYLVKRCSFSQSNKFT